MEPKIHSHIILKKIIIIALSSLMVAAIALSTIIILNKSNIKPIQPESAINIIKAYSSNGAIPSLATNIYNQQNNDSSTIKYKLEDRAYSVDVTSEKSVSFYPISNAKDDTAVVKSQTTTFMQQKGLIKTNLTGSENTTNLDYTTYTSDRSVCQLINSKTASSDITSSFHTMTCIDTSKIKTEYDAIEKVLTIYKKTDKLIDFTHASRYIVSENNVSYQIITLSTQKTSPRLLFAAVNDNWEYLGNLSGGDPKYFTGKYTVTPELQSKINDPKYNGAIIKEIH